MDIHFTTEIIIKGQPAAYNVTFEGESYHFHPINATHPAFMIKREDDEWHPQGELDDIAKSQAVSSLEKYLLSQH